ncbi:hypothetical protein [Bradyrhizobium sp. LMG 9283]|uniref:hypothetical protein n=1 Tax=Bradyrhizobium sp. LMG 9283 TaxID=592064 RepID=UPI00388D4BB3
MLPFIPARLTPRLRAPRWALGFLLIVAAIVLGVSLSRDPHDLAGTFPESGMTGAAAASGSTVPAFGENWTDYGGIGSVGAIPR